MYIVRLPTDTPETAPEASATGVYSLPLVSAIPSCRPPSSLSSSASPTKPRLLPAPGWPGLTARGMPSEKLSQPFMIPALIEMPASGFHDPSTPVWVVGVPYSNV